MHYKLVFWEVLLRNSVSKSAVINVASVGNVDILCDYLKVFRIYTNVNLSRRKIGVHFFFLGATAHIGSRAPFR
jgi:hypothetical protein